MDKLSFDKVLDRSLVVLRLEVAAACEGIAQFVYRKRYGSTLCCEA